MRYKKYFVLDPEPYVYPHLENDVSERRIQEELNLYAHLKMSDRMLTVDGGLTYFIIDANWVGLWRKFMQGGGAYPGKIINEPVARLIAKQRGVKTDHRYMAHDNNIVLVDNVEVYCLSVDFWEMF